MPSLQSNTLASFHQFIGDQLASESASQISPEQALALWREFEQSLAAIRDGLADEEAGRMRPADEVLREMLNELNEA
jgi:predicted transcriptional regulator